MKEEGIKKDWSKDKKNEFLQNLKQKVNKRRKEEGVKKVKDGRKKE